MGLQVIKKNPEAIGERWEDFDKDTKLLIAGLDNDDYKVARERAFRLIAKQDAGQSLENITVTDADKAEHDIQSQLFAKYILKDWSGDVTDENGKPLKYSEENAFNLLRNNIEVFIFVLKAAQKVDLENFKEKQAMVGKSLPALPGSKSGKGRPKNVRLSSSSSKRKSPTSQNRTQ